MKLTHRHQFSKDTVNYGQSGAGFGIIWEPTHYSGTVTVAVEAYFNSNNGSPASINLIDSSSNILVSATTSSGSLAVVRSNQISSPAATIMSITYSANAVVSDRGLCLLVFQDTGANDLTATEIMVTPYNPFQLNNFTNTAAVELNPPFRWKYVAAEYDGTVLCYADAWYRASLSKYGVTVIVQEDNGSLGGWTTKATLISAGTSTVVVHVQTSFTPTSGRTYRLMAYMASTKGSGYAYDASIRVYQSGTITKTVCLSPTGPGGGVGYHYTSYDSAEFSGFDRNTIQRSNVVSYAAPNTALFEYWDGGSWQTIVSTSITAAGWWESSSPVTMPATAVTIRGSQESSNTVSSHLFHRLTKSTAPSTSIKTMQGLARASVKSVQGLVIASVKTVEGLA